MVKEILRINNDMQSSINLNLDHKDKSKKDSYILTSKSVEVINEIVSTFENNEKNKAKILIGPYGKGKSHLALYIINLISELNRTNEEYNLLLNKSKELGEDEYENISSFMKSKDKYLPVILNSTPYNKNFSDILIYSLKNALEMNGINDIELDFYFEKAIQKIALWEQNYEIVFKQFKSKLNEDIKQFKSKLRDYNQEAYKKFKEIYIEIMGGEEFNPYMDIDPIKIYREVSYKLKDKGYNGIFVLYDEFSKYIEYLISKNLVLDIKLLQDFAEFCNRMKDQKVNMLLISHKSIGQYTTNSDKSSIDNWKAIEGRFDKIQYSDFSNQQYEIISSAINKKEEEWKKFKVDNSLYFDELKSNSAIRSLFNQLSEEEFENWIVYESYPLHPIATYCLPRISERVAQNERTLFSFLCKNENNSLLDYVNSKDKEVKLDAIYDYFEDNIKSLGYTDETFKILNRCNWVLENIHDELEQAIVKSIAIIHMINNFTVIKPNIKTVNMIYGKEGKKALQNLIDQNHIIQRKLNDVLDISNEKDIEILNDIKNVKENNRNLDINTFLNDTFNNVFVESRKHNDENSIIRYFKVKFASDSINNKYIIQDLKDENVDGIIYISSENIDINVSHDVETIFIKNNINIQISEIIRDLHAVKKLKSSKVADVSIKSELDTLEAQYESKIRNYIDDILNIKFDNKVVYKNSKLFIKNKKELSKLVSDIMDKLYFNTPIINNEMINKSKPSTVVLGGRKKVIDQILKSSSNQNIVFKKGSLESTVLRSTLLLNNAIEELGEGKYKLNYNILNDDSDKSFDKLAKQVDELVKKSIEKEVRLDEIYEIFTSRVYGFGLKKGPIPIVLAFILNKYKKYLSVLHQGREVALTSEIMDSIELNPNNFTIRLEEFNNEKEVYIKSLEKIFEEYIKVEDRYEDNLTYLVLGIKKWFLYLTKYAKDTKKVYIGNNEKDISLEKCAVKFKNKVRILNENSIRFLFDDLLNIFETDSYKIVVEKITALKHQIDNLTNNLYINIDKDIKTIFSLNEKISINNGLYEWKETINTNKVYKNGLIGGFITIIENNKELNDMNSYLNKLSNYLLGIYVSDWNDETPKVFLDKLIKLKEDIGLENTKCEDEKIENAEILEIAITANIEFGDRANMLLDDLNDTLHDYGSSVTAEEKRAILVELLRHLN